MVTQILFAIVLVAVAAQRLLELRKSHNQVKALIKRGGKEHASGHYTAMVLVHVLWFVSMFLEVYVFNREFTWFLFVVGAVMTLSGNTLRFLSMKALGDRWTVRIVTLPNAKPITSGIYKRFRHPIYLGVVLEIAGIPLLHSAYYTALLFSLLNGLVLQVRIREEEKALRSEGGYDEAFGL
jgi:methyltransferase